MKTAGIDVGFDRIKVVIADDGKIVGKAIGEAGCLGREDNINKLYEEALAAAGLKAGDVEKVVSTGIGKFNVKFSADQISDAAAAAKAAKYFNSDAKSVVDAGADQTRVVTLDRDSVTEIVLN